MTLKINHSFVSGKPQGSDTTRVYGPQWDADHSITGTADATQLNANVVQAVVSDTNVTGAIASQTLTLSWSGTLAASRLNANVVQAVTNDTNITGSISAQNLTLGWSGTLAAARLNANVVQAVTNDTNITGSISAQNLTFAWSGTLSASRGGFGANISAQSGVPIFATGVPTFTATTGSGSVVLASSPTITSPTIGGTGLTLNGSTSGTTLLRPSAVASGTITLPATTDTVCVVAGGQTLTNKTISGASNTLTNLPAANISGNMQVANFNSGTGASTSTFLRGDMTWATPAGGGTVSTTGSPTSGQLAFFSGATSITGVSVGAVSNALGANVSITNTTSYFDGPVSSQGAGTGTFYVIATCAAFNSNAANNYGFRLWDGTTVIASGLAASSAVNQTISMTLAGIITNPAGSIKLSVRNFTNGSGNIQFNGSGDSKDCNITVYRIS